MLTAIPSLRTLRVFLSVAKTGGISKCAEQICRAPSAVTRTIHDLEDSLDIKLFERKSRGMLLTSYGEAVLRRTEQIQYELLIGWQALVKAGHTTQAADGSSVLSGLFSRKKLTIFVDLADQRHMPAVARLHGISQPAVSMAIRELEHALGLRLFLRNAKGIEVTPAGGILAMYARRAIAILKLIPQDLGALRGNVEGTVTIGALPLGRTMILPTAISQLIIKYPQLRIQTIESPYEAMATGLRDGEIDFILGALRPHETTLDFETETLFTDVMSLIARRDHPLTKKSYLTANDFVDVKWVLSRRGSPACESVVKAFEDMGLDIPTPVVTTGDLAILRSLLLQTDLITAISTHQLLYEIADKKLQVLKFQLGGTQRPIGITKRAGCEPSPAAARLIEEIRTVVAAGDTASGQTFPFAEDAAPDVWALSNSSLPIGLSDFRKYLSPELSAA